MTVDAVGAQAEVQKFASSIVRLKDANARMALEMKEAKAQMKEALKEMKLLEKQGLLTSDAYKYYEATLESAREEVADYTKRIAENTKSIETNQKAIQSTIQEMKLEDMTMSQLRNRAADLQKQMSNTSASLSPEAYKKLGKELDAVNARMRVVGDTNKNMLQQFAGMNHPVGTAAKAIIGFGQALKVLIANPIGVIIMLIVTAFMALKEIIESNEESMNALNRILAPVKLLFESILHILQKVVVAFLNFIEAVLRGVSDLIDKVPFLKKILGDVNDKAKEAVQLEKDKQELQKRQREELVKTAEKEKEIAKLRNEAKRKDLFSDEERLKKLNEAMRLEKEISEEKVFQAKETLRLLELEAKRSKGNTELNDKLAQARANVFKSETEHYNKTRRMESEISTTTLEIQRERAEAAKTAMENRLKEIDKTLDYEINLLKKSRMEGLLTEKEYNDKVEQLTIEALHNKINIKGQEKHKIIQYEAQILDAQIKQQEKADAILMEDLTKVKDDKLRLLEVAKNAQLEKLQETEEDQAIYALRAKEIESQVAEKRLEVIKEFSESVQQAEFNNAKNRAKAIADSSEDVLSADKAVLKSREDLLKQFAKTTASFEKQYNIKTWEQRKEDETRILTKQYEAGLLSKETYELALLAIEKKYDQEKQKVREQYGLVSMSERYDTEMELLKEQREKEMLTEEEFEKAKLAVKLKYAQEYAQKAANFASMASGTVSALMDAETANIEARYNAEIAAAGDNKEEVERLENEKAKKKLDIEKKYADVQFAVTAAEIVANTAMAIMQAYAQLGPVAGTVAAVLMGITGAAQLAVANAERKKVKNMTMGASSSSSAQPTGTIVMKEGFSEGGSNTSFSDGGYTGDSGRYEVAGWLPVHGGEYVVPVPELQRPDVAEKVHSIERIRRRRTSKNPLPGFAEGGYNAENDSRSGSKTGMGSIDKTIGRLTALIEGLISGDIAFKTNYGVTEYQAAEKEKLEAESNFTKK